MHYVVVTDLKDVPRNRPGNLLLGQFPFKYSFAPYAESAAFSHSLEELGFDAGDEFFVVAHAVVVKLDDEGNIIQSETAFGGCLTGATGNRWWFYTAHTVQECEEDENKWNFPVWTKSISHIVLVFDTPTGCFSIKVDNFPGGYYALNDLMDDIMAYITGNFIYTADQLIGVVIKGGSQRNLSPTTPAWQAYNPGC